MEIAIICTTICVLALCALVVWMIIVGKQERQDLYNRLQAGTLRDYIANENERIMIQNDQNDLNNTSTQHTPPPDPDLDYGYDLNNLDEQTMIDLQNLEENFAAAMMNADTAVNKD